MMLVCEFERLAANDFAAVTRDGRWYFCMVYLSEVCAALGDAARAVNAVSDVAAV